MRTSWADCIAMVRARHPDVATLIIQRMRDPTGPPTVSAQTVAQQLIGVEGVEPLSWAALEKGQRPPRREPEDFEPGVCRHGWQHEAASRVERQHRGRLAGNAALPKRTSGRSATVDHAVKLPQPDRFPPDRFLLFRVLLLRRLRSPLPVHVSVGARAGVLGRRGFAVESAGARICREGGGRVVTNAILRDFDLAASNPADQRRVEILADGLPLFGWSAVGSRHHIGCPAALRRSSSRGCEGWCGDAGCSSPEGENAPQTRGTTPQGSVGWGTLVGGGNCPCWPKRRPGRSRQLEEKG